MLKTAVMFPTYKVERASRKKSKTVKTLKRPCPFIQEPYDEALCSIMLSQSIDRAMFYCGSNFKECDIYKRWS